MPSRTELVAEQSAAIVDAVQRHGNGRLRLKQLADVAVVIGGSPVVLDRAVRSLCRAGRLEIDTDRRVWLADPANADRLPR